MLTDDIKDYILSLKPSMINRTMMFDLFSKRLKRDITTNKPLAVEPPKVYPYEPLTVPAGTLTNQKEAVNSTVGLFFFNMYFIADCFGDKIPYINDTLKNEDLKSLNDKLVNFILKDEITTKAFTTYQERLIWLNNFTEILIPGYSLGLLIVSPKLKAIKAKLLKDNEDIIKNNDAVAYAQRVEGPLKEAAKEELKNDPAWPLFDLGGKPSFGNNYKNMILGVGPILNTVTGKYEISTNSFAEGIPPEKYYLYANSAIYGAYSRGVDTQYGGARTKELFSALQSVHLDVPGFDCKTPFLESVELDKANIKSNMWSYISVDGELVLITPDNADQFIGKTVKMRSPMYCFSDNICQYCAGDLFRRIGIVNIGPATTKLTSTFLNLALKKMHDQTVKAKDFDPFMYINYVKG